MQGDQPERRSRPTHPDVVAGLVLIASCAAALWVTTTFGEVPALLSQNVPPTFFPRLILYTIMALSLVLVATGLKRGIEPKDRIRPRVLWTVCLFVLVAVLVPRLGMLATVFLVSAVLPVSWGERRPIRLVILALGLPLAIHIIFVLALGMRFPRGLLW